MQNINEFLEPLTVNWVDVILDPNNPRFAGYSGDDVEYAEKDFANSTVQKDAFDKLLSKFSVSDLRKSIANVGFLSVDRMVVRPIKIGRTKKYVVVEGNRRMAAIQSLLTDWSKKKIDLSDFVLESIQEFDVLSLREGADHKYAQHLIQGIRHMSGPKPWQPYQQSLLIATLREKGLSTRQIAEAVGLKSAQEVNKLDKARNAFEQMMDDEDFADQATNSHFSFFVEALGKPNLKKKWFDADGKTGAFKDTENRQLFYRWITEEIPEKGRKKLQDAKDLRKLEQLYTRNPDLFDEFATCDELDIDDAMARLSIYGGASNWVVAINEAMKALKRVERSELEDMPKDKQLALVNLKKEIEKVLKGEV